MTARPYSAASASTKAKGESNRKAESERIEREERNDMKKCRGKGGGERAEEASGQRGRAEERKLNVHLVFHRFGDASQEPFSLH